jgi:Kef-type K+ transport system membrane component KefB
MHALVALLLDAAIFIGLAWLVWRLFGRTFPFAIVPIALGLAIAGFGGLPAAWGVPSASGQTIGWLGVMLLAFAAGLETRHAMQGSTSAVEQGASSRRVLAAASMAILLPFIAGTLLAYYVLAAFPQWGVAGAHPVLGALAVGLCVAVSALPVLIGIVRELAPAHRPYGRIAVRIAVIDDAALWIGLTVLLLIARQGQGFAFSAWHVLALCVPVLLLVLSRGLRDWMPPAWALVFLLPAYLAAGAWASTQLGLHELLGAYFAGVAVPAKWLRLVPIERLGQLALMVLAPMFFGHSGLKVQGDALNWSTLQVALLVLAVSVLAKLLAVWVYPPMRHGSRRETLAIGVLLQCKGLMEIVAATILRDAGLISEFAFAVLTTLAILSTLMTGPVFRWLMRHPRTHAADAPAH